ncbi:uncharacterized protein LOC111694477 [Trichogramma pretiosum]|uniref:uncharacterized protein LOC111694477 n=1 Tax=Trichogramma pretiosum TaxID=7493 RepID=UPI000C71957A|nr:uncharacterized protein LOC111694477 [Trichogramma pretiosum]
MSTTPWVSYELNKPKYQTSKIKYLVVFCNDKLELSEDNKLTMCSSKNSYPFQFESMDICQIPVLQDMLVTNTSCKFYKFATGDQTIDEFCQRLMLSSTNKKIFNKKCLTSEFEVHLKKSFLTKLIFLDNQPCRESLKNQLKDEIECNEKDYLKLQNKLIKYTSIAKKSISNENFQLLMSLLNDMFVYKNISAVKTKSYHTSNVINILYKKKITYLINVDSTNNGSIKFDDFFPKKKKEKSKFSLNDLYTFFCNEYTKNSNIKFFVIYTNSEFNFTDNNVIQNNKSEQYYPLKLNKIDVSKKRYKIFQNCSKLNKSMLFEFASEDYDALLELLNPPNGIEYEIDVEKEKNNKLLFLHTLIIATGQTKMTDTDILLQNEQQQLPYNLDQLQEVTLRWLEFQKHQIMTLRTMRLLLTDIQNNRTSRKYLKYSNVADEWKLTRSLCRTILLQRNELFDFLINGRGKVFIQHFKNAGIDLRSIANVMRGVPEKYLFDAFEAFHNFWFDEKGNKTKNFLLLEKNHLNIQTVCNIARMSHIDAVDIIQNLFDLWFDSLGGKTKYLSSLEREGINFTVLGAMLNGSRHESRLVHENLYNLWFDEEDNKTKYVTNYENNNLSLSKVANIAYCGGMNCVETLKDLHDLWFDEEGNKTKYLFILEDHNIDFHKFIQALYGSRTRAVYSFKQFYYALFDKDGNPTKNLQYLRKAGVKFSVISTLLYSSGNCDLKITILKLMIFVKLLGDSQPRHLKFSKISIIFYLMKKVKKKDF